MPFTNPLVVLLGIAALVAILSAVVIIPENKRGAVMRLGRYLKALGPGWHVRVPGIDSVTKVDLDASIPGWQTLSDRELEAAVQAFVSGGAVSRTPVMTRNAVASKSAGTSESQALAAWLLKKACDQTGVDLSNDGIAQTRLAERAASALEELRSSDVCDINLPFLTADASGPKHFSITLTRSQVEQIGVGQNR